MEEKKSFVIEYQIKSSPRILFGFLSVATSLSEWFADQVEVQNDLFTFTWDGYAESARLLNKKDPECVEFVWEDGEREGCCFEMRVKVDDLTGDVALLIRDECPPDEEEEIRRLWDASVARLMKAVGSL